MFLGLSVKSVTLKTYGEPIWSPVSKPIAIVYFVFVVLHLCKKKKSLNKISVVSLSWDFWRELI